MRITRKYKREIIKTSTIDGARTRTHAKVEGEAVLEITQGRIAAAGDDAKEKGQTAWGTLLRLWQAIKLRQWIIALILWLNTPRD